MATKIVISETPPYFLDLDAPTLGAKEVEEDGVKVWLVWCKYCNRWHAHGPGEGAGLRTAGSGRLTRRRDTTWPALKCEPTHIRMSFPSGE